MIETERLIIKHVTLNDVNDIYQYVSNPYTMRFERFEFKSTDELAELISYFAEKKYMYTVREIHNNTVIGHITLIPTNPTYFNEYSLGYILHEDYQNKVYCTEASWAIIQYGFQILKVHRIRAACNPENIGSWKVMEKLGMKKEAHFKNRVCFRRDEEGNPIYTDEYVYAINIEDFKDLNKL